MKVLTAMVVALTTLPAKICIGNGELQIKESDLELLKKVGGCRANCLEGYSSKIFPSRDSESECRNNTGCFMCWENCALFFGDFRVWGAMCGENGATSSVCFLGCRIACQFYGGLSQYQDSPRLDHGQWTFGYRMSLDINFKLGQLNVSWAPPVLVLNENRRSVDEIFVYGLFWTSKNGQTWTHLAQTSKTEFVTRNGDIVSAVSDILVVAATKDGIVANQSYQESLRLPLKGTRQQKDVSEESFRFVGSKLFIAGITVSSILCGMIILLAGFVLRHYLGKIRRRNQLSRGYAFRGALTLRQFLTRSFKVFMPGSSGKDSADPGWSGDVARSPALRGRASLVRVKHIHSLPGTPYITRQQTSVPVAARAHSYENLAQRIPPPGQGEAEVLGEWATEVVVEMFRASQIYTSTPHHGGRAWSFLDTPYSHADNVFHHSNTTLNLSPPLDSVTENSFLSLEAIGCPRQETTVKIGDRVKQKLKLEDFVSSV